MRKSTIVLLFSVLSIFIAQAQVKFDKGYYITKDGKKIECLIKNKGWYENPTEFSYKRTNSKHVATLTVDKTREFVVEGEYKYISAEVNIDQSPTDLRNLSHQRGPIFEKKLVFLRVLLEGKATLYSYRKDGDDHFFYKIGDAGIQPLIFKEYLNDMNFVAKNDTFKIQLLNNLVCDGMDVEVDNLSYYERDLVRYFAKYNKCIDINFRMPAKPSRKIINMSLYGGINSTALTVSAPGVHYLSADFKKDAYFQFGYRFGYILPILKNRWEILAETEYVNFNATQIGSTTERYIDFKSLNLSLGLRYNQFINEHLAIYGSVLMHSFLSYNFDSEYFVHPTYSYSEDGYSFGVKERGNVLFSAGGEYRNFFAEARYYVRQDIMGNSSMVARLDRLSLCVGYKFLTIKSKKK